MSDLNLQQINPECLSRLNDSYIKCEEKGKKLVFCNSNRLQFIRIKVDGCVITDNGSRCDFLILIYTESHQLTDQHFIELKGNKIEKAIEQLKNCFERFKKITFYRRYAYIVSSHVPRSSTKIQQYKYDFKKKFRSNLFIKNREIQVDVLLENQKVEYSFRECLSR